MSAFRPYASHKEWIVGPEPQPCLMILSLDQVTALQAFCLQEVCIAPAKVSTMGSHRLDGRTPAGQQWLLGTAVLACSPMCRQGGNM